MMGRQAISREGGAGGPMASFELGVSAGPDPVTITLAGDCDLAVRDQLTAVLLQAVHQAKTVFVDVAAVVFFDSTAVHALVTAYHAAQRREGHLYVTKACGAVAAVLEMTGLDVLLRAPAEGPRHA
jgi:anti-sigma B factor antagonist